MSLIAIIVVGFLAGLIARALMPGDQSMSLIMTTVLGVVGSFIGGFIGNFIYNRGGNFLDFHPTGLLFSVIGSLVVLGVVMMTRGRGAGGRPLTR